MQKFGFFNALLQGDQYDRKYNANDYSDNLAVVISNGVLRSENDDLKVTASGRVVKVAAGRAWINGHYYNNTSEYQFDEVSTPTTGNRYDRVILRFNNDINSRNILLTYVKGEEAANAIPPAPIRQGNIYDLVIATIYSAAGSQNLVIADERGTEGLCGWLYSNSKGYLFKRYNWQNTLTTASNTVQFNIPQYEQDKTFIEVYVNGFLQNETTDYTINNNIITFLGLPLIAGTEITVKCYKSVETTGIMSVADEITELQNQMTQVIGNGKFVYVCTGLNDNISLSQIAQAFINGSYVTTDVTNAAKAFLEALGGNTYLAGLAADTQISIDIVGKCSATSPYSGNGTTSACKWFSLGDATTTSKKLIFNFAKCEKINITCGGNTENIIFYGADLHIKDVNIKAQSQATGCKITMIQAPVNTGRITADDCRFEIITTGAAQIAEHGTYTNCYAYISSGSAAAYCFKPKSTGLIRLIGGEFYAYGWTSSGISSAIMHTSAGDTDAVLIAENIHCPVVARTNFTQGYLSVANAGNTIINGVVSRLTSSGNYNNITNQIDKNKA